MGYIIIGGDARFEALARLLATRGERVAVFGRESNPWADAAEPEALSEAENIVVNCPPRLARATMTLEEVLVRAADGATVFACGPGHPANADSRIVDLWADEALLGRNARLTAEAAIASAMRASTRSIAQLRCLVVGWGRIGRALTELLVAIGARVTVASRSPSGRRRAVERGAEAADTGALSEALPGHRLIFNTAPAMVLDAGTLGRVEPDAMVMDLASPPYGVDLSAAWGRCLRAWREPGLPGRCFPYSAAEALLEAMDRLGGREVAGHD